MKFSKKKAAIAAALVMAAVVSITGLSIAKTYATSAGTGETTASETEDRGFMGFMMGKGRRGSLSETDKAAMLEQMKTHLAEELEEGDITQDQYDSALAKIEAGEMPGIGMGMGMWGDDERGALTEEELAEKLEEMKARLAEKLADGDITQEQYDAALAKIEAGEMPGRGLRGMFGMGMKAFSGEGERTALTEEELAERLDEMKARLAEKLADGDITQEQYDEILAKLEAGEMPGRGSRGMFGMGGIGGMGGMDPDDCPMMD